VLRQILDSLAKKVGAKDNRSKSIGDGDLVASITGYVENPMLSKTVFESPQYAEHVESKR
jgi:hypothetical protein